jgi:hypothetical protein
MTHLIERNDHYVAGETAVWKFTIERDGSAKDVTGAEVEWYLVPGRGDPDDEALYDHTDTGITAEVTDGPSGAVEVEISSGTTDDLGGRELWHRLIVTDSEGNKQIWNGVFPVHER